MVNFFCWTPEKENYDNKKVHKSSGYYLIMLFVMYALLQKKKKWNFVPSFVEFGKLEPNR